MSPGAATEERTPELYAPKGGVNVGDAEGAPDACAAQAEAMQAGTSRLRTTTSSVRRSPLEQGNTPAYPMSRRSHLEQVQMTASAQATDGKSTPTKPSVSPSSTRSTESDTDSNAASKAQFSLRDTRDATRRRRLELPDLQRRSVPHLRQQSSTATLRSTDTSRDRTAHSTTTVSSTARPDANDRPVPGPGALRERRKKSAVWEQDVSRMRSESRLAARRQEASSKQAHTSIQDDRAPSRDGSQTPGSRTVVGTESSGSNTEGSGPVIGDRRRKKSSTSSASKRAAARAAQAKTSRPYTPSEDRSSSTRRSSDASRPSTIARDRVQRVAHLADAAPRAEEGQQAAMRRSTGTTTTPSDRRVWPRSERVQEEGGRSSTVRYESPRTSFPLRRFASDADAPPHVQHAANGTGRSSRISVDTSGVSRFLGHSPTASRNRVTSSSMSSNQHRHSEMDDSDIIGSPSEAARLRRISNSSAHSMRSSGGASDLHRTLSRASMRRTQGRDVFDDAPPPLPDHSAHPLNSPRFASSDAREPAVHSGSTNSSGSSRGQSLRAFDRQLPTSSNGMASRTDGRPPLSALEEVRAHLDHVTGTRGQSLRAQSRSSSRASRSNVSSTPSTSIAASSVTSVRPSLDPRKPVGLPYESVHVSTMSPEARRMGSALRHGQVSSRAGLRAADAMEPSTPDSSIVAPRRSASRLTSTYGGHGNIDDQHSHGPAGPGPSRADAAAPVHTRHLQASMDGLEQKLLEHFPSDPMLDQAWQDIADMVSAFRSTSDTTININQNLRVLLDALTKFQVDAEMNGALESAAIYADMERWIGSIVRRSDDQVRNLFDSLMLLANCRDTLSAPVVLAAKQAEPRRAPNSLAPSRGPVESPQLEHGGRTSVDFIQRRASLDIRRPTNAAQTSPSVARHGSIANNRSVALDTSRGSPSELSSTRSSDSGQRALRRYSAAVGNNVSSSPNPPSPYSPSPSAMAYGTASRLQRPIAAGVERSVQANSNGILRSASPRVERSPHHYRSSSTLSQTSAERSLPSVPSSLSPKKPRPSVPRVTQVNATHTTTGSVGGPASAVVGSFLSQHVDAALASDVSQSESDSRRSTLTRSSRRMLGRQHEPQEASAGATTLYDEPLAALSSSSPQDDTRAQGAMGLGLGGEGATSRIIRSLGCNAGKRSSRELAGGYAVGGGVQRAASMRVPAHIHSSRRSGEASDASID